MQQLNLHVLITHKQIIYRGHHGFLSNSYCTFPYTATDATPSLCMPSVAWHWLLLTAGTNCTVGFSGGRWVRLSPHLLNGEYENERHEPIQLGTRRIKIQWVTVNGIGFVLSVVLLVVGYLYFCRKRSGPFFFCWCFSSMCEAFNECFYLIVSSSVRVFF